MHRTGRNAWIVFLAAIIVGHLLILRIAFPGLFTFDMAKGLYSEAYRLEGGRVHPKAISIYEQIIGKYPDSIYAVFSQLGIANCYRAMGDKNSAIEKYDYFVGKYKNIPGMLKYVKRALIGKAELYGDDGDFDKAKEVYDRLVKEYDIKADPEYFLTVQQALDKISKLSASQQVIVSSAKLNSLQLTKLIYPKSLGIGQEGEILIELSNNSDSIMYDVNIRIELTYWKGLDVKTIVPNPASVSEFWGMRVWSFEKIPGKKSLSVKSKVTGAQVGDFAGKLTLEANMEPVELNAVLRTSIKAKQVEK
jgi:tetratricopeptide (TPR) repeat protein